MRSQVCLDVRSCSRALLAPTLFDWWLNVYRLALAKITIQAKTLPRRAGWWTPDLRCPQHTLALTANITTRCRRLGSLFAFGGTASRGMLSMLMPGKVSHLPKTCTFPMSCLALSYHLPTFLPRDLPLTVHGRPRRSSHTQTCGPALVNMEMFFYVCKMTSKKTKSHPERRAPRQWQNCK